MGVRLTVIPRDFAARQGRLTSGQSVVFGRTGADEPGVVAIANSATVSRTAFEVGAEPTGMVKVTCRQRLGTVEVKRLDGLTAASLRRGEAGIFHAPLDLVLHTRDGAFVTVRCESDQRTWSTPDRGGDVRSTRVGWSPAMIESPDPGLDWFVAAGLAAALIRHGRRSDPSYVLGRGVLLRACGYWMGAPKSEGWLASKFKQASAALSVAFEGNPSHQLGEYVLQNSLLPDASLVAIHDEYERRRAGS